MAGPQTERSSLSPEALLEIAMKARSAGDLTAAAEALDGVLKAAPRHPIPLRLRARVALERGEDTALARFDAALRADPGNADLHLGKAQALELAGDTKGARIVAEQIAAQAPGFIAALSFLSSLYLAAVRTISPRPSPPRPKKLRKIPTSLRPGSTRSPVSTGSMARPTSPRAREPPSPANRILRFSKR